MKLRHLVLLTAVALGSLGALGAGSAAAAPVWNLDIHHNQTNFPPGGTAQYWFEVSNVGDTATSGPITLKINLPSGLKRDAVLLQGFDAPTNIDWSCPGSAGESTVVCTTTGVIPRHMISRNLILSVNIAEGAQKGDRFASAKVEGGGAAASVITSELTHIDGEEAGFGVLSQSFVPDFFQANGITTEREAGSHPELFTTPLDFNSVSIGECFAVAAIQPACKEESESIRNLVVDLPPGFVGAPTAVGECTAAQFTISACPASSQVGRIDLTVRATIANTTPFNNYTTGVFNLSHPRGTVTDLAFVIASNPVHIRVSLDPANRYAVRSVVSSINETLPPFHQKLTIWGVPADPRHDAERCPEFSIGETKNKCSTDAQEKPFLTLPSQCEADNVMRLHRYDSWQHTGVFGPEVDYAMPGKMTDCDRPRFEPEVEINPTGKQANTPTGLDVKIKVAQNANANALATPPVKSATVTLPQGMSFSPSFADGLQSCTLAQMKLGTNEAIACPDSSRIGEVSLSTPLLPNPAEGSMYLAAQGDNPFGSLFALYLVLHDTEERGALIKIPGRIDVDPLTGQITTIFDETPQFPFDELSLKFRSGPRAPLVNPPSCGSQTIGVQIASYAQPQSPVDVSNTYEVNEGPNGTPCPLDPAKRPFGPKMDAGTLRSSAGAYAPFVFQITREDQEQELSRVTSILPPGLVAKIAGIPLCSEQAIASVSAELGAGQGEQSSPACPAASQIGSISAGLGAGPGPNYFPGKVYLAGPYKGAQLSLAVVAPGIAGPFDLGNVVVRAALHVNPDTTRVRAVSDPFPTILHGVLLRVRDVNLMVDRPQTTINPTNCSPMSIDGEITGVGGSIFTTADDSLFNATSPFKVGSCASLAFKPKLAFRLFGGTKRGSHPKLRATVTMPPGGANIKSASVALPHSEFLDQGHIGTVCTRVQFQANACPAASVYGTVSAKTPLLDETLTGPIYLRSSSHKLPDLVAAFRGGRIDANLVGRIDSVNGGIRNSFDFVPDVPVSTATFSFFGGSKGLLVNSRDICKSTPKAKAVFNAQNGDQVVLHPALRTACSKAKKKSTARRKRSGGDTRDGKRLAP